MKKYCKNISEMLAQYNIASYICSNKTAHHMDAQKTFILLTLVAPAQEIIERLESRFYSEKDIPWLNEKLRQMASVASRMMRKGKHMAASPVPEDAPLNEYHIEKYLGYFRTLEGFFRYHMEN